MKVRELTKSKKCELFFPSSNPMESMMMMRMPVIACWLPGVLPNSC